MSLNESWAARAARALTPNYKQQPVALVRGQGVRVWDADGKEYLDFIGGVAVDALGHCAPALVEALVEQARTVWHVSNHFYIPRQIELAEALLETAPWARRAFLCNSGCEANEAMLKLARRHFAELGQPERNEIVACDDSFHGRTLFTVTVGGQEKYRQGFGPLPGGVRHVPYGDVEALRAALGPRTAAFIVEPTLGEAGVIPAPEGYLAAAREATRRAGALLCLDEIQTGMGRTGTMFAFQHTTIVPDVMTLAKGLGNGVPIGACLARGAAAELFKPGNHGSTFGGNPLACAAGLAVVETLQKDNLLKRAELLGQRMNQDFKSALAGQPFVTDIRNQGLMIGIELDRPCGELVRIALDKGLLINVTADKVVRLLPPLILSDDEADQIVSKVSELIIAFGTANKAA